MTLNCHIYLKKLLKRFLLSLDSSKAVGLDQIPATFLRDSAEVLAAPLKNVINLSMKL